MRSKFPAFLRPPYRDRFALKRINLIAWLASIDGQLHDFVPEIRH